MLATAVIFMWLRIKETYLIAGIVLGAIGIYTFASAHPSQAVEIDGVEASYVEFTKNGSYDHNELQLQGDSNTYNLDKNSFHPILPEKVYKDGRMQIWVDQGTTTIIAITLFDANDENPTKYTTDAYDNPTTETSSSQTNGIELGVLGAALIAVYVVWLVVARRRREALLAGAGSVPVSAPGHAAPQMQSSAGVSPDGKWYWDGSEWRQVSDDGTHRWDGTEWIEMGTVFKAKGAPPPPAGSEPDG